jgi:hypothetical protein
MRQVQFCGKCRVGIGFESVAGDGADLLAQQAAVQVAQGGAGVDAELVDQAVGGGGVGGEGLGLAALPIERGHELADEALVQGMAPDQVLEFGDEAGMAAQQGFCVNPVGQGGKAQRLQARNRGRRARHAGQIWKSGAAPQLQGRTQFVSSADGIPGCQPGPAGFAGLLEPARVDRLRGQVKEIHSGYRT